VEHSRASTHSRTLGSTTDAAASAPTRPGHADGPAGRRGRPVQDLRIGQGQLLPLAGRRLTAGGALAGELRRVRRRRPRRGPPSAPSSASRCARGREKERGPEATSWPLVFTSEPRSTAGDLRWARGAAPAESEMRAVSGRIAAPARHDEAVRCSTPTGLRIAARKPSAMMQQLADRACHRAQRHPLRHSGAGAAAECASPRPATRDLLHRPRVRISPPGADVVAVPTATPSSRPGKKSPPSPRGVPGITCRWPDPGPAELLKRWQRFPAGARGTVGLGALAERRWTSWLLLPTGRQARHAGRAVAAGPG